MLQRTAVEVFGGWGGRSGKDGANAASFVFGPLVTLHSSEGQERLCPIMVNEHHMLVDSAGPGKYRGGVGTFKRATILPGAERASVCYLADRGLCSTWGLSGGLPSGPICVTVGGEGWTKDLGAAFFDTELTIGEEIWRSAPGGGGLGDPLEREPELVLEDVKDDYVSIERAKKDYGVVIKAIDAEVLEYEIDYEATEKERAYIRENRDKWLQEDPEVVAQKYYNGEIDRFDVVRKYGVVIDYANKKALPNSTAQYRELLKQRKGWHIRGVGEALREEKA